jgi:hypothetical protein
MSHICEWCNLTFNCLSSLNNHKKTARNCISIQVSKGVTENITIFECEYCDMTFTKKNNCVIHIEKCKKKHTKLISIKEENETLKETIKKLKSTIRKLKNNKINVYEIDEEFIDLSDNVTTLFNELPQLTKDNLIEGFNTTLYPNSFFNSTNHYISDIVKHLSKFVIVIDMSRYKVIYKDKNNKKVTTLAGTLIKDVILMTKEYQERLMQIAELEFDYTNVENLRKTQNLLNIKGMITCCVENRICNDINIAGKILIQQSKIISK